MQSFLHVQCTGAAPRCSGSGREIAPVSATCAARAPSGYRCDGTALVELTFDLTCSVLGAAMHNLASSYQALGRHQDALVLQEKTLEFQRRVLPENHPDIGVTF